MVVKFASANVYDKGKVLETGCSLSKQLSVLEEYVKLIWILVRKLCAHIFCAPLKALTFGNPLRVFTRMNAQDTRPFTHYAPSTIIYYQCTVLVRDYLQISLEADNAPVSEENST